MKILILSILTMIVSTSITIVDFETKESITNWRTTNDSVMGGVSTSSIAYDENGFGIFSGTVSTANNGGFGMVRLPVRVMLNEGFDKIVLKVKGDGKKYQFRLKSSNYQRHWYVQSFQTSNKWEEISLQLKDFYPSYRGYRLNKENFSDTSIREIAFLIGNKVNEDFKLVIDSIRIE